MTHTQGKWRTGSTTETHIEITNDVTEIAAIHLPAWGYDAPKEISEAYANARLIAAAPDMLAMLKDLLNEMQGKALYATRVAEVRIIQLINQIEGK